jgi:hypothetical protein
MDAIIAVIYILSGISFSFIRIKASSGWRGRKIKGVLFLITALIIIIPVKNEPGIEFIPIMGICFISSLYYTQLLVHLMVYFINWLEGKKGCIYLWAWLLSLNSPVFFGITSALALRNFSGESTWLPSLIIMWSAPILVLLSLAINLHQVRTLQKSEAT